MSSAKPSAQELVAKSFSRLVDEFAFSRPAYKGWGREFAMDYHRRERTVRIGWENGAAPWIEVIYPPVAPGECTELWCQRLGIERTRRLLGEFPVDAQFANDDHTTWGPFLTAMQDDFIREWGEWLGHEVHPETFAWRMRQRTTWLAKRFSQRSSSD